LVNFLKRKNLPATKVAGLKMKQDLHEALKERTIYGIAAFALVFGGIGIALVVAASFDDYWKSMKWLQSLLNNFGGLLLTTFLITVFWELLGKRLFLDEILHKAGISRQIENAGIADVYPSFQQFTGWKSLFSSCSEIDIFFSYGHSWRSNHREELKSFLSNNKASLRVILPNPEDKLTMDELARQFGSSSEQVENKIKEAIADFQSMAPENQNVSILLFSGMVPHITFYRFGKAVVFSPYNHSVDRAAVPVFLAIHGGFLYSYFRDELIAIEKQSTKYSPKIQSKA
jgi:hypothetical protein